MGAAADSWYKFKGTYGTRWNLVFADIVITVLPLFALFLFAQNI